MHNTLSFLFLGGKHTLFTEHRMHQMPSGRLQSPADKESECRSGLCSYVSFPHVPKRPGGADTTLYKQKFEQNQSLSLVLKYRGRTGGFVVRVLCSG